MSSAFCGTLRDPQFKGSQRITPTVPKTQPESTRALFATIGVRQFGDPVLKQESKPIQLPHEAPLASEVLDCLSSTIKSARKLHNFTRGVGLAAPQIGVLRRIAIIHPRGELPIRMINPRAVRVSRKTDLQFEGCLSFFDFRGEVRRPVSTTIEYEDLRGNSHCRELQGDAARLALHEIDHLDGVLYVERMTEQGRFIEADERHP
jgi:peptide deformylase